CRGHPRDGRTRPGTGRQGRDGAAGRMLGRGRRPEGRGASERPAAAEPRPLKGLGELRVLWLERNALTDAGGKHISGLGKLEELNLSDNRKVTDGSVAVLKTLRRLKTLNVRWTGISDEGAGALARALPGCKIVR